MRLPVKVTPPMRTARKIAAAAKAETGLGGGFGRVGGRLDRPGGVGARGREAMGAAVASTPSAAVRRRSP
jgi:hypothetical protein